jgi:hypothetical protein
MLASNPNNCIIFNAVVFNSNSNITSHDNPIAAAAQKFREFMLLNQENLNYHPRAERILTVIKQRKDYSSETWDYYWDTYVSHIVNSLINDQYDQALEQIKHMLNACELDCGISTS